MSVLLPIIFGAFSCWLSKRLFAKWFNPLFIYSLSWAIFIFLYEVKLIRYISIQNETWVVIIFSFLSFLLGIITFFSFKYFASSTQNNRAKHGFIFNERKIIIALYIFSFIGLIVALQHWMVLINKFGSIATVFLRANLIYKMRVEGDIQGTIPYLNAFSYAAVFLGGIYTAIKGKITLTAILPLLIVIVQDMASVGRAGIFMAFILFTLSFFFTRHYYSEHNLSKKLNKINLSIALFIIIAIFLVSTTVIKNVRGSIEKFKASTSELNELERSYFISPSLYLYFSSNIGVLSKYLEKGGEDKMIGENTFQPLYNLLSKINIVDHPGFYPKGYFIPMWTNSATYLRDIHEDFGYMGIFLVPFILGLLSTYLWFKFFSTGSIISFIFLVYSTLIIAFSTFYMVTRAAIFILSLIILLISSNSLVVKNKELNI